MLKIISILPDNSSSDLGGMYESIRTIKLLKDIFFQDTMMYEFGHTIELDYHGTTSHLMYSYQESCMNYECDNLGFKIPNIHPSNCNAKNDCKINSIR